MPRPMLNVQGFPLRQQPSSAPTISMRTTLSSRLRRETLSQRKTDGNAERDSGHADAWPRIALV